jgi:hypothetical protein
MMPFLVTKTNSWPRGQTVGIVHKCCQMHSRQSYNATDKHFTFNLQLKRLSTSYVPELCANITRASEYN